MSDRVFIVFSHKEHFDIWLTEHKELAKTYNFIYLHSIDQIRGIKDAEIILGWSWYQATPVLEFLNELGIDFWFLLFDHAWRKQHD